MERDQREFEGFYVDVRDDCLRIALISVGGRQLAEDLVAEAFTRAWMSWPKVREHLAPRAWVVRDRAQHACVLVVAAAITASFAIRVAR